MATRKTATSSKSTPKKAATATAKKTSTRVRTAKAEVTRKTVVNRDWTNNLANLMVGEVVGTFVLTIVALYAVQLVAPLYVGLAYAVLVLGIGAVSGAHVNPAVTFGLWSMRRLKTVLVPFYWVAQLVGALGAVVVMNLVSGTKLNLSLGHFTSMDWSFFTLEMIGAAVFLFGLAAVLTRDDIRPSGKALGAGLSLMVGLVVATSMFAGISANVDQSKIKSETDSKTGEVKYSNIPHAMYVKGATLNPAVALADTEKTTSELTTGQSNKDDTRYSRLSFEVILGTLVGAAVGGNLYLLLGTRLRR